MNDANRLKTPDGKGEAFLAPVFVTEQEEAYLLSKIEELGGTPVDEASDGTNGNAESPRKFKSKPTGWRDVKGRRSMYWGGSVMKDTLVPLALPAFMENQFPHIIQRVAETGAFDKAKHKKPNHVLVNEYLPGQGIFPHGDGPAYFPTVTTLSLGSHTILDIFAYKPANLAEGSSSAEGPGESSGSQSRPYDPEPVFSILLPRRSLFILRGELYTDHLHGIAERHSDSLDELKKCINWEEVSSRRSRWEMGDESNETTEWLRGRRVSLTMRSVEKIMRNVLGLKR